MSAITEAAKKAAERWPVKHGMRYTKLYKVWAGMLQRCRNPNGREYHNYGGRGIKVCERWLDFMAFYADMGDRPFTGAELERKDNDGNYEPGNVKWATRAEQTRNQRNTRMLTFRGESHCIPDWAKILGIPKHALYGRLYLGWTTEAILTTPRASRRTKDGT